MIDKLAWIHIIDNKVLFCLSKGKNKCYLPGGKREKNETDVEALVREIKEETNVDLMLETIKYYKTFYAEAHGKENNVKVKLTCYFANYLGTLKASSEIEKIMWIGIEDYHDLSVAGRMVMDDLLKEQLIK